MNLAPGGLQALVDQLGDPWIDGAAQDQKRILRHAGDDLVDAVIEIGDGWIEMLIDRRSENRDRGIRIAQAGRIGGGDQLLAHHAPQLFQGIGFHKGHLARVDRVYLGLIAIEKNDIQSAIGEDDAQGKTHMAASADNDNLFRFLHELLIASFWMSADGRIVNCVGQIAVFARASSGNISRKPQHLIRR